MQARYRLIQLNIYTRANCAGVHWSVNFSDLMETHVKIDSDRERSYASVIPAIRAIVSDHMETRLNSLAHIPRPLPNGYA